MLKQTLKRIGITATLEAISALQLDRLFPRAAGRGIIFTLHNVRPASSAGFQPNFHLAITPQFLEQAILATQNAGLLAVHLHDLPACLAESGSGKRFVCFTLDDGYRDNATHATPVFRKYRVPHTIFISKGLSTHSRSMWWLTAETLLQASHTLDFDFGGGRETVAAKTLAEKQKAFSRFADLFKKMDEDDAVARIDTLATSLSIDPLAIVRRDILDPQELAVLATHPLASLGGHTVTHCNLARVSDARLQEEILQSCAFVADITGKPTQTLAYPYGNALAAGPREFAAARAAGLKLAVTTRPGVLSSDDLNNLHGLRRVSLNGLYQKQRHVRALMSGLPFKLTG